MIVCAIELTEWCPECATQTLDHPLNPRDVIIRAADEREETLHRVLAQHAHS